MPAGMILAGPVSKELMQWLHTFDVIQETFTRIMGVKLSLRSDKTSTYCCCPPVVLALRFESVCGLYSLVEIANELKMDNYKIFSRKFEFFRTHWVPTYGEVPLAQFLNFVFYFCVFLGWDVRFLLPTHSQQ